MKYDWLHRERMLIGDEAVERLKNSGVMIFGVGGVGGGEIHLAGGGSGGGGQALGDHGCLLEGGGVKIGVKKGVELLGLHL